MPNRRTQEEFDKEVAERFPTIQVKCDYTNNYSICHCVCLNCGRTWEVQAKQLLSTKYGCWNCGQKIAHEHKIMSDEEFKKRVDPSLTILEPYTNCRTPILVHCNVCGKEYKVSPLSIANGHKCKYCANNIQKTTEQFIKEISISHPNIKVIGEYKTAQTKIKLQCIKCGHIWETKPNAILCNNSGCPKCNCNISKGEIEVQTVLDTLQVEYIPQHTIEDCKYKRTLHFDFFLPDLNKAIEFDGEQHFTSEPYKSKLTQEERDEKLRIIQDRDEAKNKYCKEHSIDLLRIPYWERGNTKKLIVDFLNMKGGDYIDEPGKNREN